MPLKRTAAAAAALLLLNEHGDNTLHFDLADCRLLTNRRVQENDLSSTFHHHRLPLCASFVIVCSET